MQSQFQDRFSSLDASFDDIYESFDQFSHFIRNQDQSDVWPCDQFPNPLGQEELQAQNYSRSVDYEGPRSGWDQGTNYSDYAEIASGEAEAATPMTEEIQESLTQQRKPAGPRGSYHHTTPWQREQILKFRNDGLTNRKIAERLGLRLKTVESIKTSKRQNKLDSIKDKLVYVFFYEYGIPAGIIGKDKQKSKKFLGKWVTEIVSRNQLEKQILDGIAQCNTKKKSQKLSLSRRLKDQVVQELLTLKESSSCASLASLSQENSGR